jgi:hypothetical protein
LALRQGGLFDVVAHGRVLVECRRRKIGRVIAYSQRETIAADILFMGPVTGVPDYSTGTEAKTCGPFRLVKMSVSTRAI